jgi:tetratricopeptide (TPR) repeat protein
VAGGLFYFTEPSAEKGVKPNLASSPFEKLTPEQQQYVKDTYRLADSLFKQGRYELARQEILKVHELVPVYLESKTMEQLADVAIQTQIDQQKALAREQEQREMENKIIVEVEKCRGRLLAPSGVDSLDECLATALSLNPAHPEILKLRGQADQMIAERALSKERAAEFRAQVRRRQAMFQRAEKLLAEGETQEAIRAFEAVANSSLPDPSNLKMESRRRMASIQQNLAESQSFLQKQAEEAQSRGDLRSAYLSLSKAHKISPNNEVVKGKMVSIQRELRKQMQSLYQEAILEESVGEVESAKTKWKKIVESSVPDEEYYRKSVIKLKRYGISN